MLKGKQITLLLKIVTNNYISEIYFNLPKSIKNVYDFVFKKIFLLLILFFEHDSFYWVS